MSSVLAFVALFVVAAQANAAIITVGAGGGYDFATIQAAIDAAGSGDTIRVANGTYFVGEGNYIDMTKVDRLTLQAEHVGGAVIDGQDSYTAAVEIDNGDIIRGFWLRNVSCGIEERYGDRNPNTGPWIAERCIVSDTEVAITINDIGSTVGNGVVRNCTVYQTDIQGIGTNDGNTLDIFNTLIVKAANLGEAAVVEGHSNRVSIDFSNIYGCRQNYDNAWGHLVIGEHMYYSDPLFVDPAAGDFRLQAGSPLVDLGIPIDGLWGGYEGAAPDIGAYEIPEPTTSALLALAGPVLLAKRRSKNRHKRRSGFSRA